MLVPLASFVLPRSYSLYLRCISIVSQELAKLQRYNLLDEVLLVNVLKVAADILHEGGYLLLVYVSLDYLVHDLIELFLADFLGRGDGALFKLLAYLLLDIANLMLLTAVDNADGSAFLAGTTSTA